MSKDEDSFGTILFAIGLVVLMIIFGYKGCAANECSPETRGNMRVSSVSRIIETCNGQEWVPAKGDVVK